MWFATFSHMFNNCLNGFIHHISLIISYFNMPRKEGVMWGGGITTFPIDGGPASPESRGH